MLEVSKPQLKKAKTIISEIEMAYTLHQHLLMLLKLLSITITLQMVLTDEQRQLITKGILRLIAKKMDRLWQISLMGGQIIITTIPLKSVHIAPEMTQAIETKNSYWNCKCSSYQ